MQFTRGDGGKTENSVEPYLYITYYRAQAQVGPIAGSEGTVGVATNYRMDGSEIEVRFSGVIRDILYSLQHPDRF
jgi:hypothetical protein